MGCIRIDILEEAKSPLKVVYRKSESREKEVQRFKGVDPLASKYPSWSPYNYTLNNPLIYTDPTGMSPDWIDNGDGTWTAEIGDSAWSLSKDAGVSPELANLVVEGQLRPNYIRESDGMLMSDVEVGDRVSLSKNRESNTDVFQSKIQEVTSNEVTSKSSDQKLRDGFGLAIGTAGAVAQTTSDLLESTANTSKFYTKTSQLTTLKQAGKLAKLSGVGTIVTTALDVTTPSEHNGYLHRGLISGWATFIPYVGPYISVGLSQIPAENYQTTPPTFYENWGSTCFVAGTKITMVDGSAKNVENVKKGDEILSVDILNGLKIEGDLVLELPIRIKKYLKIRLVTENGIKVEFSPAHPFWVVGKGWSVYDLKEAEMELDFKVQKIELGDELLILRNGELQKERVTELENTKKFIEMYNVEHVAKNHTFFANGILVHNKRGR